MNTVTLVHGLMAYHRPDNVGGQTMALYRRTLETLKLQHGEEICVADRLIGPIGMLVSGQLRVLATSDCWSNVDAAGKRYPSEIENIGFLEDKEGIREADAYWLAMLTYIMNGPDTSQYVEGFMAYPKIQEIWIKEYAMKDPALRKAARRLAKVFGVRVRVVTRGTRVWEIWPPEDPEFRKAWEKGFGFQEYPRLDEEGMRYGYREIKGTGWLCRIPYGPIVQINRDEGLIKNKVHKVNVDTWSRRGEDPDTDPEWWGF